MTLKERIKSLLTAANATTGKSDTSLTAGVQSLIDGFGGGDGSFNDYLDGTLVGKIENAEITTLRDFAFTKERKISDYTFQRIRIAGEGAFQYAGIVRGKFPELANMGRFCFADCAMLEDITLSNEAKIGYGCFLRCKKLKPVTTLKITGDLGGRAFEECNVLPGIDVTSVTSANDADFRGCEALKSLDFHVLNSIGAQVFKRCKNLETLIIRAPELCVLHNVNAFDETPIATKSGYIYIPEALVEQYKATTNWVTYADQIRAIEDYPEITGGAV